jgi:hypothetical protein
VEAPRVTSRLLDSPQSGRMPLLRQGRRGGRLPTPPKAAAWKRHPAALCVTGVRRSRCDRCDLWLKKKGSPGGREGREGGWKRRASPAACWIPHKAAGCRFYVRGGAGDACRLRPAACQLRRRRRSAPLQQAQRWNGRVVLSTTNPHESHEWRVGRLPIPSEAAERAACWIPHKAAGCRFYVRGGAGDACALPLCRLPTPPKAAERAASASAALEWAGRSFNHESSGITRMARRLPADSAGGGGARRLLDSPQSGRMPLLRPGRRGGRLPPCRSAACQLRRRRRRGSGILPLCA